MPLHRPGHAASFCRKEGSGQGRTEQTQLARTEGGSCVSGWEKPSGFFSWQIQEA